MVDAVERATERARRDVRDLIAKSVDDGVKLAEMTRDIENIGARRWPDPKTARSDDAAATETLRRLDRLREALSARCEFLGVLREGAARARAPVRVSLEPKAPPTELDEDARRARDEAAAAAAAVAAASKVVKKITDDPEEGESRKTMLRLTDELVESTRVAVKAAAEPYYAEKDPERAITRPDKIPPTLEELCAGKEAIVAELREEVAKHAEKAGAEARLVVVGIGDFVANAAEALTERALRDVTNRVDAAFHRVTAEHTPSARALVARRAEHKRAMRPALALPARRDELDALLAAEKTRAKEAAAALGAEAEEVAAAIAEAAVDGEGRLARAAHLVARLASDLVTPEDLRADGPGAAAAATLGRKNLKQLRRIRHEATHGSDGAERRDAASRPHKERAWPALDVERLAPDRCGYVPIDASIPPDAEDDAAEERAGGEDGAETGAETGADGGADGGAETNADAGTDGNAGTDAEDAEDGTWTFDVRAPVWGLDVVPVHAALNARDRAWDAFVAAVDEQFARHGAAMARRLQDEKVFRGVWAELRTRALESGA